MYFDITNTRPSPVAGRLPVGAPVSAWSDLFNRNASLSDVWRTAQDYDPLLWMLRMSGYRNDSLFRHFACWAAEDVQRLVRYPEAVKRLIVVVRSYAEGQTSRDDLDQAYEEYTKNFHPPVRDPTDFARGIDAAHSAVAALVIDEAYTAARQAASLAETAIHFKFSYEVQRSEGVEASAAIGRQAVEFASEMFRPKAAEALRLMIGDPFLLIDADIGARHLDLLRRAIAEAQ